MSEDIVNLSINGQSQVPPGFRFHPTEEELLHYYLRKKVASQKIDLDVIRDVDLNKLEPWDIQEKCKIGSTPQNDWYFFSHKDKKYPTGTRTNRATAVGFWKATGRDKIIYSGFKRIGLRKTLVFYKGRAPHGQKSDWIMHEYRLNDSNCDASDSNLTGESVSEDGWVVCRVFRKKNYQKSQDSPKNSSNSLGSSNNHVPGSSDHEVLDQILMYIGRSNNCKLENESLNNMNISADMINNKAIIPEELIYDRFMHLPRLETPSLSTLPINVSPYNDDHSFKTCYSSYHQNMLVETEPSADDQAPKAKLNTWAALDRLVAFQLNGHEETSMQLSPFCPPTVDDDVQLSSRSVMYNNENDLWGFNKSPSLSPSPSSPLCHLSV